MSRLIETLHRSPASDQGALGSDSSRSDAILKRGPRPSRVRHRAGRAVGRPHFLELQPSSHPVQRVALDYEGESETNASSLRQAATNGAVLGLNGPSIEAYADLYSRIADTLDLSQSCAICCTSASPSEGKTSVSLDIAFVAATIHERRVLFIDANLSRPSAAHRLGVRAHLGLSEVLCDGVHPSEAIQTVAEVGYDFLGTGQNSPRATELVGSRRMSVLLWDLKESYDLIVVDVPHVSPTSTALLSVGFDGLFLVAQMHWTSRRAIEQALGLLDASGCTPSGCVLVTDRYVRPKSTQSIAPVLQPPPDPATRESPTSRSLSPARDVELNPEDDEGYPLLPIEASDTPALDDVEELVAEIDSPLSTIEPTVEPHPNDGDELVLPEIDFLRELESDEDATESPEAQSALHALDAETLRQLETVEPFDGVFFSQADDVALPPARKESTLEELDADGTALHSVYDDEDSLQPPAEGIDLSALFESVDSISEESEESDFDAASESRDQSETASVVQHDNGAFRVSRISRGRLDSPEARAEAAASRFESNDPWAANVLAISGLLLLAATILYLAGDVLLWF